MYTSLGGQNQVLNLKKVAIITLLTLVLSMTFMVLNPTFALTNNDQKQKAETLLSILNNDNRSIVEAFSKLDAQNITVPKNAETKYNEGLAHAEEAVSLMNEENFSEASIEAVEAMQKFEDTLRILEDASPVEPTETEVTAEEAISLKANITRAIEHVRRLENLTVKAATAGYNTLAIEKRLSEVKQHLENATRELTTMNLEGATEELCIAKTLFDELNEPFDKLTNLVKASNTEKYLEEAEIRVSETKANITISATLTPEIKEDAITALNNSETNLANARDSIENDNVDEAIGELEEAKKWEEESNRAIASVAATPTSVAPTTESFTRAETTVSK
jgi:tetratricopeptide (TPR) repeat protein